MSISEISFLILLILTLLLPLRLFKIKNRLTFAHPLIFYSLIMLYYTVLSPFIRIVYNETSNKLFDFRDQFILGWKGALLSVISVLIGYSLKTNIKKKFTSYCDLDYQSLWRIGLTLNIIGLFFFMIARGFDISAFNPFNNQSNAIDFLTYGGGFSNYLISGQEIMITGNLLMFAGSYSTQRKFPLTLLSILISCGIFLNSGFRFRFFFLFVSIIFFILTKENKLKSSSAFNISIFSIILVTFLMTYIGQIRMYGLGLNFDKLSLTSDFLKNIFIQGESSTFITTSGLINIVPEKIPFQNFYPIIKSLLHPFPSLFFEKNSGDYIFNVLNSIYGFRGIFQGAAYLNFGEYYLMFGWFGIFIFNFLLGYIFKRFWFWVNLHKKEPLAILVYILNLTFTFLIISRGYLPQQLHLYIFIVFPAIGIYFLNLKRKLNTDLLK